MQIQTTRSYHFTSTSMAVIKIHTMKSIRMWRNWNPHKLLVRVSNGTPGLKTSLCFLKKLNMHLPYYLAIPFWAIYSIKGKHVHTKTCTQWFIALFRIAKKVEIIQKLSTNWWVDNMCDHHTMGYYLVHKSNKNLNSCYNMNNLKNFMLTERSHMQMFTYYLYEMSRKGKSVEKKCVLELPMAGGMKGDTLQRGMRDMFWSGEWWEYSKTGL